MKSKNIFFSVLKISKINSNIMCDGVTGFCITPLALKLWQFRDGTYRTLIPSKIGPSIWIYFGPVQKPTCTKIWDGNYSSQYFKRPNQGRWIYCKEQCSNLIYLSIMCQSLCTKQNCGTNGAAFGIGDNLRAVLMVWFNNFPFSGECFWLIVQFGDYPMKGSSIFSINPKLWGFGRGV